MTPTRFEQLERQLRRLRNHDLLWDGTPAQQARIGVAIRATKRRLEQEWGRQAEPARVAREQRFLFLTN